MTTEDEIDKEAFADLPSTDINVEYHVHFGMTGSFPLWLAELFFADDGLYIVEYAYITPLFGLTTRKHRREAETMKSVYDYHGIDEVLLQGDSITWLSYDNIDSIIIYEGGHLGRTKLVVYADDGPSYAYRIHDISGTMDLVANVNTVANRNGFTVESETGIGFDLRENIRRFLSR
jgi:hypothetical protein